MSQGTRTETAAVIVLARRSFPHLAERLDEVQSARALLTDSEGGNSGARRLFSHDGPELDAAAANLAHWESEGIRVLTVLDPEYPDNLRAVHDRPALIFLAGALRAGDERAVAVIGSRNASADGLEQARKIANHLVGHDYAVVSGLAAGIDTAAHTTALDRNGRTLAVLGTGLHRAYPPQNEALQRRIANYGAVVSQFWPDDPPSRRSFPLRNATMSGLARATVIVEAGPRSGARVQARMALAHGRPVFMHERVLAEAWAQELAQRPGTRSFTHPEEVTDALERLGGGALVS